MGGPPSRGIESKKKGESMTWGIEVNSQSTFKGPARRQKWKRTWQGREERTTKEWGVYDKENGTLRSVREYLRGLSRLTEKKEGTREIEGKGRD